MVCERGDEGMMMTIMLLLFTLKATGSGRCFCECSKAY